MQDQSTQTLDQSFHEMKLENIDLFTQYIVQTDYTANLWSSNFAYLWAISQSSLRKIYWKIIDGMLVVFVHTFKNTLYVYCPPFGKGSPDKVNEVLYKSLQYCLKWNNGDKSKSIVKMLNTCQLDYLKQSKLFSEYFSTVTWNGIERHYDVQRLAKLSGKEFSNIRNRVNKFKRDYPQAVIRYCRSDDIDKLLLLDEKWSSTSGKKYTQIFDKVYYRELVSHYKELGQLTIVIELDHEIIGMTSGSILPTGQAWGSVTKFIDGMPGLSETLIIEYVKAIHEADPDIKYLNVGSDLGAGGLREYKLKFHPVLNYKRYQIYLK